MKHIQNRFLQETCLTDFAFLQCLCEIQSYHTIFVSYFYIFVFNSNLVKNQVHDSYDQFIPYGIYNKGSKIIIEDVKAFYFNMSNCFFLLNKKTKMESFSSSVP